MNLHILIVFSILVASSYANTIEFDYCVADPALPHGPTGYACKDPAKATSDDFAYSGLRTPGNTSNIFKFGASLGLVAQFPALNGLGISIVRGDMDVGGAVPLHTHRVSELIVIVEGTIIAGFIDTNNTAFYKTLEKGDLFVIPPTLEHFQVNVGKIPSVLYASFSSPNPGVQIISNSLFQSDLPTEIIQKITLLDPAQIKKLKRVFGGTN
ncbi:auxin-binding protein ABP19a-like [Silene latifolia]|uniref:auxin-binding protein ABP19a-like n=1 Tax=Silene latifolia TaxID=37657 RepID=UPI003D7835A1